MRKQIVEGQSLPKGVGEPPNTMLANSITIRIIHTSLLSFLCYLTVGILLAVLAGFVHLHLYLSALWAGVAVSSQYVATLVTRPKAGRMTDVLGFRSLPFCLVNWPAC